MVAERQVSGYDDAGMVAVSWDTLKTGNEVFMLSSGFYLGPYKVVSSKECILWAQGSEFRFHYLGVLYAKNKARKSNKG